MGRASSRAAGSLGVPSLRLARTLAPPGFTEGLQSTVVKFLDVECRLCPKAVANVRSHATFAAGYDSPHSVRYRRHSHCYGGRGRKGVRGDPSIVRDFFAHHEIEPNPENFRRFFDRYVFHLEHLLGQLDGRVLPGVHAWLSALAAWTPPPMLGLLTGNIGLGARIKLGHYGLWERFETGAFGDDHEDRNQLAHIARARARARLGDELGGDQILVIGDTPRDLECARAIGAKSLTVATGTYSLDELRALDPDWAVKTLAHISPEDVLS